MNNLIKEVLQTFSRWCPNSIRQLSLLLGKPYETTRRFIKKLSSERVKEAYAKWVLKRLAGKSNFVLVAVDPTYTRGLKEGFLAASIVVGKRGRSHPPHFQPPSNSLNKLKTPHPLAALRVRV